MSFKTFDLSRDVASIQSAIHEVVAISSSIFSNDLNTKFFKNVASGSAGADLGGYWESVYDSSPTSSLSTALFDMTYGYHTSSGYNLSVTTTSSQNEKIKIYRMLANTLLGDPNTVFTINNSPAPELFFFLIKRSISKDELKKGSLSLVFNLGAAQLTGTDAGAVTNFKQAAGGDYAPIRSGSSTEIGQVWYNAGIVVLKPESCWLATQNWSGTVTLAKAQISSSINQLVDGARKKTERFDFHNQSNLFSTVYFCRMENAEFNYSSNPTFVDDNQRIRVTSGSNILQTRTYPTTIGLYDANDNLLGVGKVNKPFTKSPDNEGTFRLRLDY